MLQCYSKDLFDKRNVLELTSSYSVLSLAKFCWASSSFSGEAKSGCCTLSSNKTWRDFHLAKLWVFFLHTGPPRLWPFLGMPLSNGKLRTSTPAWRSQQGIGQTLEAWRFTKWKARLVAVRFAKVPGKVAKRTALIPGFFAHQKMRPLEISILEKKITFPHQARWHQGVDWPP